MIGQKIKLFIISKNMSVRGFAISLGWAPEQVHRWINGTNSPTDKSLFRIKKRYPDFDPGHELPEVAGSSLINNSESDQADIVESLKQQVHDLKERIEVMKKNMELQERLNDALNKQLSSIKKTA